MHRIAEYLTAMPRPDSMQTIIGVLQKRLVAAETRAAKAEAECRIAWTCVGLLSLACVVAVVVAICG